MKQIYIKPDQSITINDDKTLTIYPALSGYVVKGQCCMIYMPKLIDGINNGLIKAHIALDERSRQRGLLLLDSIIDPTKTSIIFFYALNEDVNLMDVSFIVTPIESSEFKMLDLPEDIKVF